MEQKFEIIAKTFEGMEDLLASELRDIGAEDVTVGTRMVSCQGDKALLYRSNFALRTALRILKPIARFEAHTADEVYEAVKAIDWATLMDAHTTFAVDSVVYSEEFRHSKFVAYRVKDAIVDQWTERTGERPGIRVTNPDLRLNIHIGGTDCTLSLDSSGDSLHRRGYRQETKEAPLNEVLAAGIILRTGWQGESDLIDPMCGSGTIPIEAALIAQNIAPGVYRKSYAFEKWTDFDPDLLESIYNDDSKERPFNHKIYGYDNDREAVLTSMRNVRAAGLTANVEIALRDMRDFRQPPSPSIIITNPPYGERLAPPDLIDLYKVIGQRLKHEFTGGVAWILSHREECFTAIGLKASLRIPVLNGALECELRKYELFEGRYSEMRAQGGELNRGGYERPHSRLRQHPPHNDRPYAPHPYGQRPHAPRPTSERRQRQEERKRHFGTTKTFTKKKHRLYDYDEDGD